ncbi:MAG: porin family protein [Endomicrobium sp.]|jgi:opacity protein-like surface antigen|nr:porin family protein [Endomicrobium sp.]
MKKIFYAIICASFAAGISFAEAAKEKVYIGANLSMSFEDFSYDDFIDNVQTSKGNEKTMSGPRYDFVLGYRLSNKFRIEAQYLIISQNNFETDQSSSNVEYKAQGIFANAILDFWDMQEHLITPFIGIGAGASAPKLNISYQGVKDEVEDNGFSWQVQGGINLKLVSWLILNVKYTYISMPDAKIDSSSQEEIKAEFKRGVQAVGVGVTLLI